MTGPKRCKQMNSKMGRRDFLSTAALVGAAAVAGPGSLVKPAKAATEAGDSIVSASAGELAEAIRTKRLSSKEVVEAHLERIAKVNPKLNAVVQLTAEAARKEADEADAALARGDIKGPLHGVPITIKDTLETTGVICTGGTKGRANFVPKADGTAVARLRAAGGIILGKTNVPELAAAAESDNLVYGRAGSFAARPRHRCRRQRPYSRTAYFDDDGVATPTKEIAAAVRDSAKAFADAGVKVEESRPPDAAEPGAIYFDISRGDGGAGARAFLKSIGTNEISPMFERALAVAPLREDVALALIQHLEKSFGGWKMPPTIKVSVL